MKNCDHIPELFSLHLDQELDEVGQGRLRRHLAACPDCQRLCEQMAAVDTLFREAPGKAAPVGFTQRAVTAAFDADTRRNLFIGLLALLVGTGIIGGLALGGQGVLVWNVLAVLFVPSAWGQGSLWFAETWHALNVAAQVALGMGNVLLALLLGPLLIPSLLSLLAAAAAYLLVQQGNRANGRLPF